MSLDKDMFEDDLKTTTWKGIVEDITDDTFTGRCKVRVFGKFGNANSDENSIPTESLPYAYPAGYSKFGGIGGSGSFSTPKIGTTVKIEFEDGDIYTPIYSAIEEVNPALVNDIKDSYENAQVLVHDEDEDLKIFYTKEKGLLIYNKESIINILNDNRIIINHAGESATIELAGDDLDMVTNSTINGSAPNSINFNSNLVHINGVQTDVGANPIYSSVNGEQLMILLKILSAGLDAKFPTSPGNFSGIVAQMEQLIISSTVNVSP